MESTVDYIYVVRHHFTIEIKEPEDGKVAENRVTEWVFRKEVSASEHAINLCLDLMGIDRDELKTMEDINILKHVQHIMKPERGITYKSLQVPCCTDEAELRIDEDLVEIHKLEVLD